MRAFIKNVMKRSPFEKENDDMARRGGYLGGSTLITVRPKRSKQSKVKAEKRRKDRERFALEYAAYEQRLKVGVQRVGPSDVPPSKEGERRAERKLKKLTPIIDDLRNLA